MSEDMPSWKSLASAASRSVKNYVAQKRSALPSAASRDFRPDGANGNLPSSSSLPSNKLSWTQWAGQRLRRNGQFDDGTNDRIFLFPGWAARRYHHQMQDKSIAPGECTYYILKTFLLMQELRVRCSF